MVYPFRYKSISDVCNLFYNDVTCKLYADDVQLYIAIHSDDDCTKLQTDLDNLEDWSRQLNITHTKVSLGRLATMYTNINKQLRLRQTLADFYNIWYIVSRVNRDPTI